VPVSCRLVAWLCGFEKWFFSGGHV
jgi:hypothetical protein